jgi:hypothetical protein
MKFFLFLLIFFASCADYRVKPAAPVKISKEDVCSQESLDYLKKAKKGRPISPEESALLRSSMRKIEPLVKSCYGDELKRSNKDLALRICFVGGFDHLGKVEFSQFSSKEVQLGPEFSSCLRNAGQGIGFLKIKNAKFFQPINLYPSSN